MKILKYITALFSTAALSIAPAVARVDADTPALLQAAQAGGITVALNPATCDGASYLGSYQPLDRILTVCYSGRPTAEDHDTVRHEVFHAAQHCASEKRGYGYHIQPILGGDKLTAFLNEHLTPQQIESIKGMYPEARHLTELEAFAASTAYTAEEIASIYSTWCEA